MWPTRYAGRPGGDALLLEPFFPRRIRERFTKENRAVLLDDESALIKEMLVLTFGEAWRVDIENLLDFEI